MFGKQEPEVLIVGAGPVGLLSAYLLGRRGVRVEIVDEQWRTGAHAYALALHPESMRILEGVGLLEEVLRPACRVKTAALYEGARRRAEVDLSALAEKFPFLAVLPQSALEGILEKRLREMGIPVRWNHRFARMVPLSDRVAVTVDRLEKQSSGYGFAKTEWVVESSRSLEPKFVIGADGHRSVVRANLDIPFELVGPADFFAVFEIAAEGEMPDEFRMIWSGDLVSVFWPLGKGRARWSFQFQDVELGRETRQKARLMVELGATLYPHVSEQELAAFLGERAPWFTARVRSIAWAMAIRFEARLAASWGRDRAWLVGDAAHTTSPAGIQSMNEGFREAADLSDRIVRALKEGPGVLEGYEAEHCTKWRRRLGLEGRVVALPGASPWTVERAGRLVAALPGSGEALLALLGQLGLRFEA